MSLLVNGKRYDMSVAELQEYGVKRTWHVPPTPYDTVNNKHGNSEGIAFPNRYTKTYGSPIKREEIVYFTREEYDDAKKRMNYYTENTGELIMINKTGVLITSNPELNFFLEHCPWNGSNKLREDLERNPYKDSPILFMCYDPGKTHKLDQQKMQAKSDLFKFISKDGERSWTTEQVEVACRTVLNAADRPIPQVISDYKEYLEDEDVVALRNGLLSLGDREPLWLRDLIITGHRAFVQKIVAALLSNDKSGFGFDTAKNGYYTTNDKGAKVEFLIIPEKKDPEKYLLTYLEGNWRSLDKLDKIMKKHAAQ